MKYYIRISDRKSVRNKLQVAISQALSQYDGVLTSDIERTLTEMREKHQECCALNTRSSEKFDSWKVSDTIIIRPSDVLAFTAHPIRKETL